VSSPWTGVFALRELILRLRLGRKDQRQHRRLRRVLGGRDSLGVDINRGSQRRMPQQLLHDFEFRPDAPQQRSSKCGDYSGHGIVATLTRSLLTIDCSANCEIASSFSPSFNGSNPSSDLLYCLGGPAWAQTLSYVKDTDHSALSKTETFNLQRVIAK
jgi:hypothetical protein